MDKVYVLTQTTTDSNDVFVQGVFKNKETAFHRIADIINGGQDEPEEHIVTVKEIKEDFNLSSSFEHGYDLFELKEREIE